MLTNTLGKFFYSTKSVWQDVQIFFRQIFEMDSRLVFLVQHGPFQVPISDESKFQSNSPRTVNAVTPSLSYSLFRSAMFMFSIFIFFTFIFSFFFLSQPLFSHPIFPTHPPSILAEVHFTEFVES